MREVSDDKLYSYCEDRLTHYLHDNKITLKSLADEFSCTRQNVTARLLKRGKMTENEIIKYADSLGLQVEIIFRDKTTNEIANI